MHVATTCPSCASTAPASAACFQNLIGNAVKFSVPGRPPEVAIGADRDGDMWRLWVRDNGIGMDPSDAERIFEPFKRLHGEEAYPGTGIGLAICERIVAQHGGRIWVTSRPGEGSDVLVHPPGERRPEGVRLAALAVARAPRARRAAAGPTRPRGDAPPAAPTEPRRCASARRTSPSSSSSARSTSRRSRPSGFPVELKANIGSSEIIHQALTDGALDMYPEYVGVLLSEVANVPRAAGEPGRRLPPRAGVRGGAAASRCSRMTPFSDRTRWRSSPRYARRHHLRDIARPRAACPAASRIGAPPEFRTRFEGLVGLASSTGCATRKARALAIGSQYAALDSGRVDVAAVFTTDGQLAERALRDPARPARRVRHPARRARSSAARRCSRYGPRLRAVIDAVSRRLTAPAMQRMNAQVQIDRRATGRRRRASSFADRV